MLEFKEQKNSHGPIYVEDTDAPLPEKLNPKTRYAYFSAIANGGKSIIQSCMDLHLRRTVCYKSLRPEFVKSEVENLRLLREARISARLQHPNTMPTYELGRDGRGQYYFTMKLVHGYTLREVLHYRERYDLTQLSEVIQKVASALAYAHSRGVLHRDIKPDNILVGAYGEVLLLDWGLAKVWPKQVDEAQVVDLVVDEVSAAVGMTGEEKLQGTVMYMSPEQVDRDPAISFASDVYSLGAVLYETLSGETPFQGDVVRRVIDDVRSAAPAVPKSPAGGKLPQGLVDLTMQCLEKDPAQRPESVDEFIRLLREGIYC
ncbi:serine/threonine protein kinase [Halioxenophilus aromaticivorans]|uniref:Serine/threonine-protein kinase n=1 Tax=Halioxenophilus aromaticivorans TaxID=1306992 RepID=A0AAV3U4S3_9ALTE